MSPCEFACNAWRQDPQQVVAAWRSAKKQKQPGDLQIRDSRDAGQQRRMVGQFCVEGCLAESSLKCPPSRFVFFFRRVMVWWPAVLTIAAQWAVHQARQAVPAAMQFPDGCREAATHAALTCVAVAPRYYAPGWGRQAGHHDEDGGGQGGPQNARPALVYLLATGTSGVSCATPGRCAPAPHGIFCSTHPTPRAVSVGVTAVHAGRGGRGEPHKARQWSPARASDAWAVERDQNALPGQKTQQ